MAKDKAILAWLLCGAISLNSAQPAMACAFHGYTPDPTLVDVLLSTEQVLTARLASDGSNALAPAETLMGPIVTDISVDARAPTRKRLKANPSHSVLLARDGSYGPWVEVAVLDPRFRGVIETVMKRQTRWLLGNAQDRLSYFASLLNDPNPDIRKLALRELDRAQYGDLKRVKFKEPQDLKTSLRSGQQDLMPIRVLLAGLSGDRTFGPLLSSELARAVQSETPYLGAYATALIEMNGTEGVVEIRDRYLRDKALSAATQEKLLEALALQYKTAPGRLRRMISHEVALLARSSPAFADAAARQFGFQNGGKRATFTRQVESNGADR